MVRDLRRKDEASGSGAIESSQNEEEATVLAWSTTVVVRGVCEVNAGDDEGRSPRRGGTIATAGGQRAVRFSGFGCGRGTNQVKVVSIGLVRVGGGDRDLDPHVPVSDIRQLF